VIVVPLRVSERQTILNKIESHYKDFLVCSYCISQNQLSKISSKLNVKKQLEEFEFEWKKSTNNSKGFLCESSTPHSRSVFSYAK